MQQPIEEIAPASGNTPHNAGIVADYLADVLPLTRAELMERLADCSDAEMDALLADVQALRRYKEAEMNALLQDVQAPRRPDIEAALERAKTAISNETASHTIEPNPQMDAYHQGPILTGHEPMAPPHIPRHIVRRRGTTLTVCTDCNRVGVTPGAPEQVRQRELRCTACGGEVVAPNRRRRRELAKALRG